MTEIKIKHLYLENFKCHKSLKLDFLCGNASIYGDNASGKTSIYDALTWLLFSKDSAGNGEKNIEIKPLDENGNVRDHLAETAVEAALDVNGEDVTLRRTYKEVWSTKRGSSQETYDGNTSEYYVNGVPCKRNAFQDRVNELVDEDTFRLLTSVSHFANGISWQERRAVLFQVAGVLDDRQILAADPVFSPILDSMGSLSLEDYKKKLLAEKKKFVGAKTEIPARISECQKTIEDIQGLDFTGARAEADALNAEKESIAAQIAAIDNDSAAVQKSMEIREAQLELSGLEAENRAYQTSGNADIHSLNIRLTYLQTQLSRKRMEQAGENEDIRNHDKNIEVARDCWIAVNKETFAGGICQSCGQKLPEDKLQKAKEAFENGKKSRLRDIEEKADYHKTEKAKAEERLNRQQEEIAHMETEITELKSQIAEAESSKAEPKDLEDYAERKAGIQGRLEKLNGELFEIREKTSDLKRKYRQEMTEIGEKIRSIMEIISKESLLDYARKRVQDLREEAKNAAECLESIEKMLYRMDEYSRYKTRFVEDSINSLFRIARFRLFREQANGGVEDRCDVVYDGIPYISVNNGMKINLGIDIINTLSTAYGVRVPLFVDNAESVTHLEVCGSQIIRLVVSETDKELRVDYEN